MMRWFRIALPLLTLAPLSFADLTLAQKTSDFMQLVALYAVNYAPYELKRDVFGFDLYNVQPWLDQINQSKTDVDFFDICTRYIASLQDSHDEFTINSDYEGWMHMDGDIYDGKFLIDYIDRTYLSARTYPFTIGDQLISVDGVAVADLLTKFAPYAVNGSSNPVSRQRLGAATITDRYQGWYPLASVGANATIVVLRNSGPTSGAMETYTIPWDITGTLVTSAGIIPSPLGHALRAAGIARRNGMRVGFRKGVDPHRGNPPNLWLETARDPSFQPDPWDSSDVQPDPAPPDYMAPLVALSNMRAASPASAISGSGLEPFDNLDPVFNPPAGFKLRLGAGKNDLFVSGTFASGPTTIGFIRIPTFEPTSTTTAVQQLSTEIQYFQQNTDGLVVDVMGNGGGSLCYGQTVASYLIPFKFQGVGEQLRATLNWQASFSSALYSAKASGAPGWVSDLYTAYLAAIKQALAENRGRTGNLPLCSYTFDVNPPTSSGKVLSYTKPILLLTDNFTLSTAESFTMAMQDNARATVFGTRTDGGGGNVVGYSNVTAYSQGNSRVTEGLLLRLNPVAANGYPLLPFYDGVGIQPDIVQDYMTADNLSTGGTAFVNAFTTAIRNLIGK